MSYTVTAVLPALVDLIWPLVKDYLDSAIEQSQGETNEELTKRDVIIGDAILIVIYKDATIYGAAVVRKRIFDTGVNAIFVSLLGGKNVEEWIDDAYFVAKEVGKDLDCTVMYCVGRAGWEKVLKHIGFTKAYTVLTNQI